MHFYNSSHHHQQVQGPSGRFLTVIRTYSWGLRFDCFCIPGSSHRSRTHTRESSRSSVGSITSHGSSKHSPAVPHTASGMVAASSPVLQYRTTPHVSPLVAAAALPPAAKNSPLSLASITSPFEGESGLGRSSGLPAEAPTIITPSSSLGHSKYTTSHLNQSKNFQAQTLKLGECLRHHNLATPYLHKPCTSPLLINHTFLILLTRLMGLRQPHLVYPIAVGPKWSMNPLMAAWEQQIQLKGDSTILLTTTQPRNQRRFKARRRIQCNVENLKA